MSSIVYQRADRSQVWVDYSTATPVEKSISEVEEIFSRWDFNSKVKLRERCATKDLAFDLKLIPKQNSENFSVKSAILQSNSSSGSIRLLFGIDSPFILVTSHGAITESQARDIMTIISMAMTSCKTKLPFFIQIGLPILNMYMGRLICGDNQTIYTSRMQKDSKDFTKIESTLQLYKESFNRQIENLELSSRIIYNSINLNHDRQITICFEWPVKAKESVHSRLDPKEAVSSLVSIDYILPETDDTTLKKAIRFASNQISKWPKNQIKPDLIQKENPKLNLHKIAEAMALQGFNEIWLSFVSCLKEHVDKHIPLYPFSKKPTRGNSLLQQRIDLLNCCLNSKSRKENIGFTDDFLEAVNKVLKKSLSGYDASWARIIEIRDAVLEHLPGPIDEFLKKFKFDKSESELVRAIYILIPENTYSVDEQKAIALDGIISMTPFEVSRDLIMILIDQEISSAPSESLAARDALFKAEAKAAGLHAQISLITSLDFLKRANSIANCLADASIKVDLVKTLNAVFPGSSNFVDSLIRNKFALTQSDREKNIVCDLVNGNISRDARNALEASSFDVNFVKTVQVICSGHLDEISHRQFISACDNKVTISTSTFEVFG